MVFFKKPERGTVSAPHSGKFIINPTSNRVYVDTDGTSCEVSSDIVLKQEYRWNRCDYSIILPGLISCLQVSAIQVGKTKIPDIFLYLCMGILLNDEATNNINTAIASTWPYC